MTVGAASETKLGGLHDKIADRLITEVDNDKCDPRFVQMGIKFLSDNKITAIPNENNELGKLSKSLAERKKRVFENSNVTELASAVAEKMLKEG